MKVLITKIFDDKNTVRVCFECDRGRGVAFWVGPPPAVGDQRFVEMSLDRTLTVGKDLTETENPCGVSIQGDSSVLVGEITRVDEDGFVQIDLGNDAGLGIEVVGSFPVLHRRYAVVANDLKLFDANY